LCPGFRKKAKGEGESGESFFFLALEDTVSVLPVESLRRQLGKGKSLSSMIVSNG
jgi:hypothetical protein